MENNGKTVLEDVGLSSCGYSFPAKAHSNRADGSETKLDKSVEEPKRPMSPGSLMKLNKMLELEKSKEVVVESAKAEVLDLTDDDPQQSPKKRKPMFPDLFKSSQKKRKKISAGPAQPKNAVVTLNEMRPGLEYTLVETKGPVHQPTFVLSVTVNGASFTGEGRSKKQAKQECAENALKSFVQFKNTVDAQVAMRKRSFQDASSDFASDVDLEPMDVSGVTKFEKEGSADSPSAAKKAKIETTPKSGKMVKAPSLMAAGVDKNPCMMLNELKPGVVYDCHESGDSPATKRFTMKVTVDDHVFEGTGASKKLAKQAAARSAMTKLFNISFTPNMQGSPVVGTEGSSVVPGTNIPVGDFSLNQSVADTIGKLIMDKFSSVMSGHGQHARRKVLAGIVMSRGEAMDDLTVVSVSTGTKCINGEHMSVNGNSLNDCHAEIISRRCLVDYLYSQVVEEGFPSLATFSVGVEANRRTIITFQKHLLDFTLGLAECSINAGVEPAAVGGSTPGVGKGLPPELKSEKAPQQIADSVKTETMPEPCDKTTVKEIVELNDEQLKDAEEKLKRIVKSDEIITITAEENEENCKTMQTEAENVEAPPVKTAKDISLKKRSKRPDVAVYVPRLKRLGGSASSNATPPTHLSATPPTHLSATPPTHLSATPPTNLSAADHSISQLSASALPFTPSSSSLNANALPFCPSSPTPPELEREEAAPDPLVEEIVKEITVAVGGVQIESPDIDYLTFQTSDATINLDQFGHVIELYDFPEHFKTVDLLNGFKNFSSKWDIKWVDDTHALGVFNCAETAAEALALRHPVIKTRPLNMATKQSKVKAQSVCELLLPYKPRPATSTAPARRFLSLALGYKVPEASRQEKDRLDEARRKKEEDRRDDRRKRKEDVAGREEDRRRRREDNKDYDCHDYR